MAACSHDHRLAPLLVVICQRDYPEYRLRHTGSDESVFRQAAEACGRNERVRENREKARSRALSRSRAVQPSQGRDSCWWWLRRTSPPPPPPPPLRPPPGARQICACGPRSLALVWSLYALRVNPSLGNAESVRCITAALLAFGVAPFSRRRSDIEVISSLVQAEKEECKMKR